MKQKVILVFTFLLTGIISSFAENTPNASETDTSSTIKLSGIVLDKITGEPLVGVKVKIEGRTTEVYTNFDGIFEFNNLTPGQYRFNCNLVTYEGLRTGNITIDKEINKSDFTFKLIPVTDKLKLKQTCNEINVFSLNAG
jgi:hypothetical protein